MTDLEIIRLVFGIFLGIGGGVCCFWHLPSVINTL